MFDYLKWRSWLENKATELRAPGVAVEFRSGPNTGPKPGMSLGLTADKAIGSFECWASGETDYTIHLLPIHGSEPDSYAWGVIVTDQTFEAQFAIFVEKFRENSN